MRRHLPLLVLVAVVGVVASGCSSSKPGEKVVAPLPSTIVGTVPTEKTVTVPAEYQNGDPVAGKQVFLSAGCSGCHTLADAGSHGTVGPVLTGANVPLELVVHNVTEGAGAMPSFKGQLSSQQIADVAAYVVKASAG
ncbi:MAG TPA: c-type cytochrome [Gaiellaceae bacterium]|nr:c-type cytochrome [Gaiellaceae bacterium]